MNRALLICVGGLCFAGCVELPSGNVLPNEPVMQPVPVARPTAPVASEPPPPPVWPVLTDRDIRGVYEDLLGRAPTRDEMRDWHYRAQQMPVSPDDVAAALRDTREYRRLSPEEVVRRAYAEFHHAEPDAEGMRFYRRKMIDEHWSAGAVRRAIAEMHFAPPPPRDPPAGIPGDRRSERTEPRPHEEAEERRPDHRAPESRRDDGGGNSAEAIVRRAYDDLLERKPDAAGLEAYARLLRQGASEEDIRRRIKQSEEYRVTLPDAKTRRAYREVLGRDPDEGGLQHYRKLIVDKGWTEADVENDLRKSAEYRNRRR